MAYDKDQTDFPLPAGGKSDRSSSNFLPKYFRTDSNKKFLQSTIDQFISEGVVEKINSFVGKKYAKSNTISDTYLPEINADRENYQFEPSVVYKDELDNVNFYANYIDYIGQVQDFIKSPILNHSTLNRQESYSWDPHIDWDKFTNFREYYWLPMGPQPIPVRGQSRTVVSTYTVDTVVDDNNTAFIITPDGLTRNPSLKLYKGQTYKFEINAPGVGFAIAQTREFNDNDPLFAVDQVNNSILYTTGVRKFAYNQAGDLVETNVDYIETGVVEFTPADDAPENLFYISQRDINTSGFMSLYFIEENTEINVDAEIIGKKTYTTSTGVELSNGMKIYFQGNATPESYNTGHYYVEGVGTAIQLINENNLEVPAIFTNVEPIPFDNTGFDRFPWEDAASYPATKDYITVNRGSLDRNPWSRYNRWFHKSVIETSASVSGVELTLDQDARAKRPIIEFEAGLKLYKHGTLAKQNVNIVDTKTTDVFSTIEGKGGYIIDGVELTEGMRVLFTADTDVLVNGKIYEVKFHNWGTTTTEKNRQIALIETTDTNPVEGDTVLAINGIKYAGEMFYYEDGAWKQSQSKTTVNQPPLFALFDENDVSLNDSIVYPNSSFKGNKIFSYATGSGTNDTELGFPIKYQNIANVGDIVFDFNLSQGSFVYQSESLQDITKNIDPSFLRKYNKNREYINVNSWKKSFEPTKQAVIRIYKDQINNFEVDCFDNSNSILDLHIKVFVNGIKKTLGIDYNLVNGTLYKEVVFVNNLATTDILTLKCYSSQPKNNNGFFEIPSNLENNPLNQEITTFTLGQVSKHVDSIIDNLRTFSGAFPGVSNLRDLGNVTSYGTKFIQHTGPLNLALYHMVNKEANVIKAIEFAQEEYIKFKREFLNESETFGFDGDARRHVDLILKKITKNKVNSPFLSSDMLPINASTVTDHIIEYAGEAYFALKNNFDLNTLTNKAVLVYKNDVQLIHGVDYVFENNFVKMITFLAENDEVKIIEYENTIGSYVPPTPAKLGLFPAYVPEIFYDDTYLGNTSYKMIRGHDGSIVKAYDDYRDNLILELELRIFNNIKNLYDPEKINIWNDTPGFSRPNDIINQRTGSNVRLKDFSKWLERAGNPDYTEHTSWWDSNNPFTYNYSSMTDWQGNALTGFWRNIYEFYYDTDRPHTHPWEMLGLSLKPTWWETVYGPAPYTRNNTLLWQDLRDGITREPNTAPVQNKVFQRPWLMDRIPTGESGELLDPLSAGIAKNFVLTETRNGFAFGDKAPVETAWRNSSEYRFTLLKVFLLNQPAKMMGIGFDISRIKKDIAGNFVYSSTNKRITLEDLIFPYVSVDDTESVLTSGFINYISNYLKFKLPGKYSSYQKELTGLKNQLSFKLGGFGDKSKLKLVLDSRSPLNKTSVFVPDENYKIILHTSSVQDTPSLSGLIIEKTDTGFLIKGYDLENPYFIINKAVARNSDTAITVGGISESYIEWNAGKTYPIGTVVFYNGSYYRSTETHQSSDTFDSTKFSKLAELPVTGGITALIKKNFEKTTTVIPYGSYFSTIQEVVDFMLGYEKWLTDQGFVFESVNENTGLVEDMKLVVSEYLFWITQKWETGTVLAVSPVANQVTFSRNYYTVDNIYNQFYGFTCLAGNGQQLAPNFTNIYRNKDIDFSLKPIGTNDGVYLIKLPLVQTEHVVLIDNQTVFNDIIYDTSSGVRQDRIKVVGYRTDGWTGSLDIPGFIYDDAKVTEWTAWTDYTIGDVVKHKEFYYSAFGNHTSNSIFNADNWRKLKERPTSQIYPNWDYKSNQFADFYDLDTDNFDTEQQRLAQHLIGYQPREYLANIITDSVSQYKFYQGMIQEKGTKNALTKLFDPLSAADKDSVEFYEEWALRLGQYGSIDNIEETEYRLDESKYRLEPQIIELNQNISTTRTDLIYEITPSQVYKKPVNYNHTIIPSLNTSETYTYNSGYVRDDQVSFIISSWDFILDLDIFDINVNENIWITNDNNTWNTYKLTNTNHVVVSVIETTFNDIRAVELTTKEQIRDLSVGDYIGVKSNYTELNAFVEILDINVDKLVVAGANAINIEDIADDSTQFTSSIIISKFVRRRFTDVDDVNSNIESIDKNTVDTLWLDDNGTGNWNVYENRPVFSLLKETANTNNINSFAEVFDVNKSNTLTVFGNPSQELVLINRRNSDLFDFAVTDELEPSKTAHDIQGGYGSSVAVSPDGNTIAVGAPFASNALTRYKGTLEPGISYLAGDIVSDRGSLWKARVDIATWEGSAGDSSTISSTDQDWEKVYLITAGEGSTDSSYANQGVVYLYEKNKETQDFELQFILVSPDPNPNTFFGSQVELVNTTYGSIKLFVSAPGDDTGKIYFFEKINEWKWTRDDNYKGVYSDFSQYNIGDIVYYDGNLYQALQTQNLTEVFIPTTTTHWTLTDAVEHTGYVPNRNQELDGQTTSGQIAFGRMFAVSETGDKMVVASEVNSETVVKVYNQIDGRWKYMQTLETSEQKSKFAWSIDINDAGDKIAVGAPYSDLNGIDSGAVYLYQQDTNDVYTLSQTIQSPFKEKNEVFGFGVSFSNNRLAIVGKNSDIVEYTTFDFIDENNITLFDSGTTNFAITYTDAGRIFLYQEINNKFIFGEDINYKRNTYGHEIDNFKLNYNHIYISIPTYRPTEESRPEDTTNLSKYAVDNNAGLFVDLSSTKNALTWTTTQSQNTKPNLSKLEKVFIYNIDTQDIIQSLDWIDPRQGKIAGPAEQEIAYKTPYDPATYTTGTADNVTIDSGSNWTEKHVGQVWWNTGLASWYDPYQGDSNYRTSRFNSLIPGFQIQVCEWVSSDLTPTEWNALSGTADGYAQGVSGETLYTDTFSIKQIYDPVRKTFKNRYFYWVRNSEIVPNNPNRALSVRNIANLIADPATTGYRFVALLDTNKFALYNCKSLIEGTNSVIHFRTKLDTELETNIHTEYQLLSQGLDISTPNTDIERKWIDSLVGYDIQNNVVPDPTLSPSQKYGILNFPRQGMFVNRIEAVKQFVDRVNWVLAQNQIVDNYDISGLLLADTAPDIRTGRYDEIVETETDLQFLGVAKVEQARLSLTVEYGKITEVQIVNPGRGYKYAPIIELEDSSGYGAILNATIDNLGKIVSVDIRNPGKNYSSNTVIKIRKFSALVQADSTIGNIWSIYEWNKTSLSWEKVANQGYDTSKYWIYKDWYATNYTPNTVVNHVIDQSYALFGLDDEIGDVVKIENIGSGGWLLLKKIDNQATEDYTINYETIGRQNGTIELSELLYKYSVDTSGYDASVYDMSFYDKEPVDELRNIINALKNDIFVGDLAVEYNELFFAGVRYAFNEHANIDWAFKTSFVRAKHNVGELSQRVSFQNDNLENYQDYIEEVKPYKTKIREYISTYTKVEPTNSLVTDFDLPPSYINNKITTSIASYENGQIVDLFDKYSQYPYKSWVDNNGYDVIRIDVVNGGAGYKQTPTVEVSGNNGTTAQAYLSKGSVKAIEITNTGGKYYSAPVITINGDNTTPAKAVAILGNTNVRSTHMVVKFDRVSGARFIETIDAVETFAGSGSKEKFYLKWPMNLNTNTFEITVDGYTQLSTKFTVGNERDEAASYEKYRGYVNFVDAPAEGAVVTITYKKAVSMLQAADRIFEAYVPSSGMPGISSTGSLAALMKGVEYGGVIYDSYDFGNEQGYGVSGFGEVPWDTFTNINEDEIITLDGSTNRVYVSQPFENGVEYNVYFNNVRIDYRYDTDGSTILNLDTAVMPPIIGNGVIDYIDIDEEVLPTADGDVIIIRKATSDGSFTPAATSYDTSLSGGALDYTTATGLTAGDIVVDGDGFRTVANSGGPEELVPGTITDTLDITVYHRSTDGIGYIGVVNYWTDAETFEYDLPAQPATVDSIIVLYDGVVLDSTLYTVDYTNNIVYFDDSTSSVDKNLCIITVGVNGADLIDQNKVIYFDKNNTIKTLATYEDAKTVLVMADGRILQSGIDYTIDNVDTKASITLLIGQRGELADNTVIQYVVYNNTVKSYSQIIIDKSFNADSAVSNYHKFTGNIPVPFNDLPISHRILVKSGDKILSPGYSVSYTTTDSRIYKIDSWQFENPTNVPDIDILVFVDNIQLEKKYWNWDPISSQIRLLRNDIAEAGSKLDIYFTTNAEYYFVDTKITINETDSSPDLTTLVSPGDFVKVTSVNTSTEFTFIAEQVTANSITVQSISRELRDEYIASDEFVISIADADSTYLTIENVEYILSDNITINREQILDINIIQFSNHDINNFQRYTFDVYTRTSVDEGTDAELKRNYLSSGIIQLNGEIAGTQYAWVIKNGYMLSPYADYIVDEKLNAVVLKVTPNENDRIDVLHFANNVVTPELGYRIFRDMLGRTHYKRINDGNAYELAQELNYYDTRISLKDATGIQKPNPERNVPGIIWINGERIEYFGVSNNYLLQLRRGTLGTGVPEVHPVNTYVLGQGTKETINYNDTVEYYTYTSDGSTSLVDCTFEVNNIHEIEIFVGGRRLRKNAISVFDPTLDQDSPNGDVEVAAEFTVNSGLITLVTPPANGLEVKVVKKTGQVWTEDGVSLAESQRSIGKFLREATIKLPR